MNEIYDEAQYYGLTLDYEEGPLAPALSKADLGWVKKCVREWKQTISFPKEYG